MPEASIGPKKVPLTEGVKKASWLAQKTFKRETAWVFSLVNLGFYLWGIHMLSHNPESVAAFKAIEIGDTLIFPSLGLLSGALGLEFVRKQL